MWGAFDRARGRLGVGSRLGRSAPGARASKPEEGGLNSVPRAGKASVSPSARGERKNGARKTAAWESAGGRIAWASSCRECPPQAPGGLSSWSLFLAQELGGQDALLMPC